MVVIAEIWMDHSLKEAIKIARERNVAIPHALCLYVDDSFGILKQNSTKSAHIEFAACLTDVDERLCDKFKTGPNLTNRDLLAQFVRGVIHLFICVHPLILSDSYMHSDLHSYMIHIIIFTRILTRILACIYGLYACM